MLVDQSREGTTRRLAERYSGNIEYAHVPPRGVSFARNKTLELATGEALAFTDDDCIVDRDWVSEVLEAFATDPELDAVLGFTDAFSRGRTVDRVSTHHKFGTTYHAVDAEGYRCYALILDRVARVVTSPNLPHATVGSSNNMACRRRMFRGIGEFSERFGAGSPGVSAEDTEFLFRAMLFGRRLAYRPSMRIQHDAWLRPGDALRQVDNYMTGMCAVFAFYSAAGYPEALPYLRYSLAHIFEVPMACRHDLRGRAALYDMIRRLLAIVRGTFVGVGYALRATSTFRARSLGTSGNTLGRTRRARWLLPTA